MKINLTCWLRSSDLRYVANISKQFCKKYQCQPISLSVPKSSNIKYFDWCPSKGKVCKILSVFEVCFKNDTGSETETLFIEMVEFKTSSDTDWKSRDNEFVASKIINKKGDKVMKMKVTPCVFWII